MTTKKQVNTIMENFNLKKRLKSSLIQVLATILEASIAFLAINGNKYAICALFVYVMMSITMKSIWPINDDQLIDNGKGRIHMFIVSALSMAIVSASIFLYEWLSNGL